MKKFAICLVLLSCMAMVWGCGQPLSGNTIAIFVSTTNWSQSEFEAVYGHLTAETRATILLVSATDKHPGIPWGEEILPCGLVYDLDAAALDGFVVIGGGGVTAHFNDQELQNFIRTLVQENVVLGAICGGTAILSDAGILEGRRVTGVDHLQPKITADKGVYSWDKVVVDGNLITAQYKAEAQFLEEFIPALGGKR